MNVKIRLFFALFMLSSYTMFGFTFTGTPTPETCYGNGTISFTTSNTDPNGSILYIVYKLPNVTTPYATLNANLLTGLSSGTYRVIAKETIGNISTQQQQDIVVDNNVVPLVFSVQSINQACSNTSDISVNVSSGVAVSYEIFFGPMHFPSQTSNTFSGLVVGVYKIRVFDNCGVGVVQTFTVTQNTAGITIGSPTFSNTVPASCSSTIATNTITPAPGTVLGYPLTITYTIHPPGGAPAFSVTSLLLNGNSTSQDLVETIPDYINQNYSYDITIVDACNSNYFQSFPVNKNIDLNSTIFVLDCDQNYFSLNTANYTPPYTINFTSAPAGFNPNAFNANYPGPYNQGIIQFGDATNVVPYGQYVVDAIDSCGRTVTSYTFSILQTPPTAMAIGTNEGCVSNAGNIVLSIPNYTLATAIITLAPANYPNLLPQDISSLIDANGILTLDPVPVGHYEFQVTDKCGNPYPVLICDIPLYTNKGLSILKRPGCDLQKTSIELSSKNGKLTNASITAAPAAYGHTYPYDISSNIIASGKLYLDDLPGGIYTFSSVDECGYTNTLTTSLQGYAITTNTFSLQPNCGSFDIPLNFVSNATNSQSFWLQKLIDPINNIWGHPSTDSPYTNGSIPNATNSLALVNNATNFNLTFNGTFRIIREFSSYNNGVNINNGSVANFNKECIEIFSPTLDFHQKLEIEEVTRIPCTPSGNLDVVISANGTPPLHYSIIEKNGVPYSFDNGNSNIFYGLAPGIYKFSVEDSCGNSVPTNSFNVSDLLSLVNMGQPDDIVQCQNTITGNETFDLTQQNSAILGSQSTTEYTLTYYTSQANAMSATNPITNLTAFDPSTNPQTIYARLIFNTLPNCYETRSFNLVVGQKPFINLQSSYLSCNSSAVNLDASGNNLSTTTYAWSTGAITPAIAVSQPGINTIHVDAVNTYGTHACPSVKDIVVTISQLPKIDHIDIVDWTPDENSISVYTSNVGDFEYSIDGISYQSSSTFSNLFPGIYTVYVRDRNGCGITTQMVLLLYYKRYFTPNDDGINDTWNIENGQYEPGLKVVIYDRFGKMITSLNQNSIGWDGTYDGQLMFATDYWFVVYRGDGRIQKGHFTLKR